MLRQLQIRARMEQLRHELEGVGVQEAELARRSAECEAALSEAKTGEDFDTVNAAIEALEKDAREAGTEEKKSKLQAELDALEAELAELDSRSAAVRTKPKERGKESMNRYQIRELLRTGEYYERSEVREFYEKFRALRGVTGGPELTIPQIIVNRILDILGDYTTVYPLVDKIRASGATRILLDTDTTPATWIEQIAAIPAGDVGTIINVDFDGFKVGKVTFVDNSLLEDSIVNLDDYVTKKLARSIGMALDIAILKGEGSASKQPSGIIPALDASHKVTVDGVKLADILRPISLIDTGEDSVGEIVAVMKRATYYKRLLDFTVQTDSAGNVVGRLPNLSAPNLLGLRVVFNNNLDEDTILYGDYSKYTLVERESVSIDKSEHVKFVEDQMAFRGKGRFDGKPVKKAAFVLVTIQDPNA